MSDSALDASPVGRSQAPGPLPAAAPIRLLMLAFDEMELLDFAGPYEVFTTANRMAQRLQDEAQAGLAPGDRPPAALAPFVLHIASSSGQPVRARAGLMLQVDSALAEAPACDWLLVPGGVVDELLANDRLLAQLRQRGEAARLVASICTGAFVLAAAGLLHHAPATTHWEDAEDLARRHPDLQVDPSQRWIDNGRVLTSAGIAAGIDLSLHLVRRAAGEALARRTARQMDTPWSGLPA